MGNMDSSLKPAMNAGARKGQSVPVFMTSVMLPIVITDRSLVGGGGRNKLT